MNSLKYYTIIALVSFLGACKNAPDKKEPEMEITKSTIKEESVSYNADTTTLNGFVVYDEAIKTKRPVVLIIHEWWGLNDYVKSRARQLAALGYIAIAVDLYGNNKVADNPQDASELAKPIYANPSMAKKRFDAALAKIKTYSVADTNQMAAIGYCFGGAMVLNFARLGEKNLKGVVCFHGNLAGVPISKNIRNQKVLVCNGGADEYVNEEEIAKFKMQMDSIKADYTFKSYPDATHAFTNPASTEAGEKFHINIKYNAAADKASWDDMRAFFAEIFRKE